MNSILFDIGGTKTRIAYSDNGDFFEEPKVVETPKNYEDGIKSFANLAKECANGREIKRVVGGMSRNVTNWNYEQFKNNLGEIIQAEIFLENDAAMVGLGEATHGAGRGFEIVAYVTVSTGVGGARIVDQKIDEHAIGFEPGKQIIDITQNKTLENLVSGKALELKFGKSPKEISDEIVWQELAKILAVGLNNIIVEWSPNVVVLGGSMITGNPAIPLHITEQYLKGILKIFPEIPPIKKAELGDFGGLWGALAYLHS